jgi:hypothetical protein
MRSRCRGDRERGTVTAEFAVALPAVLLVLAACLGGLRLGADQLRLIDAAAVAARSAARGEEAAGAAALSGRAGADGVTIHRDAGGLVCAVARGGSVVLGLRVPLTARACALGEAIR